MKSCKDHAIEKPQTLIRQFHPLLIEVFSTIPHDSKALWFGRTKHDKQTKTNKGCV